LASYVTDTNANSDSDAKASWQKMITPTLRPSPKSKPTRPPHALGAECSLKLFGLASIRALPNRGLLPGLSTRLQVVAFRPLQGSPRTSDRASFRVRSNRRRGRVAAG